MVTPNLANSDQLWGHSTNDQAFTQYFNDYSGHYEFPYHNNNDPYYNWRSLDSGSSKSSSSVELWYSENTDSGYFTDDLCLPEDFSREKSDCEYEIDHKCDRRRLSQYLPNPFARVARIEINLECNSHPEIEFEYPKLESRDECKKYSSSKIEIFKRHGRGTEQILDFVFKLLIDITKYNIICWSGSEFEFVIIDQNEVAKLWATKRNNPKMNAAKFLRALRDKYKCKMIEKGDRNYEYRFRKEYYGKMSKLSGEDIPELVEKARKIGHCYQQNILKANDKDLS